MKTPYLKINKQAFTDFDLSYDKVILIGIKNSSDYLGYIYEVTKEELAMYMDKNIPEDSFDIKNYHNKKAFIIPGSTRTAARMLELLKANNITLVNDYKKADFYINNSEPNAQFSKNNIFFNIGSQQWYSIYTHDYADTTLRVIGKYVDVKKLTSPHRNFKRMRGFYIGGLYFNILSSGKDLVHESSFLDLEGKVELTEDLSEQIMNMIKSNDDSNFSIASKIIPTIDTKKNQAVLFEFFEKIKHYTHYFNKDKDCKKWFKESGVKEYKGTHEDILLKYHSSGRLTKEGFKYLEKRCRQDIQIYYREIYNFKVNLKEEYKKYI
jgi:hypothetical protein